MTIERDPAPVDIGQLSPEPAFPDNNLKSPRFGGPAAQPVDENGKDSEKKATLVMMDTQFLDELKPGEFIVGRKSNPRIVQKEIASLCCRITNKSKIRRVLVEVTESRKFEWVVGLCIVLNCIEMALHDYYDENRCKNMQNHGCDFSELGDCLSTYNKTLAYVE
jgi:hypothetical protein